MMYTWCIFCCVILCFITQSLAQFPAICEANITRGYLSGDVVCCPTPKGEVLPCGGPAKGECARIPEVDIVYGVPSDPDVDFRLNWPHRYINLACSCHGNHYGPDCSQCRHGYTGSDCRERARKYVRRNAMTYTSRDKRVFVKTLLAARATPSGLGVLVPRMSLRATPRFVNLSVWDMYQWIHYVTAEHVRPGGRCERPYIIAHRSAGFPTWHRLYMLWIEGRLREISPDPNFSLPYWDWVTSTGCDVCTNDFLGAQATSGSGIHPDSPFADWYTLCQPENETSCDRCDPTVRQGSLRRTLGGGDVTNTLPTAEELAFALSVPVYDVFPYNTTSGRGSFRSAMEGDANISSPNQIMHNQMHNWIGGHMGALETAANDPIFLLVHSMVDRIFEMWLHKQNPEPSQFPDKMAAPGHNARDPIVPLFPVEYNIDYFRPAHEFGYSYDSLCQPGDTDCQEEGSDWTVLKIISLVLAAVTAILLLVLLVICVLMCCRHKTSSEEKESLLPAHSTNPGQPSYSNIRQF